MVMVGTCAEYDWRYGYCSESITPLLPGTLYGRCKGALRSVLEPFAEQAQISWAWGRLFFLYGPNEHPDRLVASVIRRLLAGEPAPCSVGNQVRDFLHVQDAAEALVALLGSDFQGSVNVASGKPTTVRELVLAIAEKVGRSDLLQFGAQPVGKEEPPLLVADVRRLNETISWHPQYDLDAGLVQTIAWWKVLVPESHNVRN